MGPDLIKYLPETMVVGYFIAILLLSGAFGKKANK